MSIEITGGSWKEKYDKLQEAYEELEAERDTLQARLDEIAEIASPDAGEVQREVLARFDALEAMIKQATSALGPVLTIPSGKD